MSTPKGYSSQEKEDRLSAQFSTVEPVREHQFGLSVNAHQYVYNAASDAAEAGSTAKVIVATGHAAKKGDILFFYSGSLGNIEVKVWDVGVNSIELAEELPAAPIVGDTFDVLRHKYPVVNSDGTPILTLTEQAIGNNGVAPSTDEVKMMGGFDGTDARYVKTDIDGELQVDVLSSALPTGAATEAKQDTGNTSLGTIAGAVSAGKMQVDVVTSALPAGAATELTLSALNGKVTAVDTGSVTVVSSALPTGAATAAKQPALGTAGSASADVITVQGIASMTALKVDGSAVTQPISAAALPLPSGAATSAAQTDGTQKTKIVDAAGGTITSTTVGPVKGLDVNVIKAATDPGNDVFATAMVGTRYNQIEVNFETAPGATFITQTFAGGGAVTHTAGHALYSTSTAASAQAKAVSVGTVIYRPANEIYAYFTAAFTTPTSAASYQRIGLYDTNNGFFMGYEGTSFGITVRNGAVDSSVPRASFNGDLLTGAAGSKFTRNGAPEAINLAFSNLFRIRFGWLGSGSILFDVFSPDGVWVNFHTIKQPNSSLNPSIQNPNLPITLDVKKTASDATNLVMATACWAGGTASAYTKITDTLTDNSLAGLTRSVITGVTTGGGGGYVNVKVNPSGALVADVTGTVAATQSGTWNIATISNPLPAGTNTIGKVDVNTLSPVDIARIDYTVTSVTTAAYTQLKASLAAAVKEVEIFDSSGQTLLFAVGGAGSEVDKFYIIPGGNGRFPITIAAASRVAIKAVSATANTGEISVNFLG